MKFDEISEEINNMIDSNLLWLFFYVIAFIIIIFETLFESVGLKKGNEND